jgi:hypothetical protein
MAQTMAPYMEADAGGPARALARQQQLAVEQAKDTQSENEQRIEHVDEAL